MLRIVMMQLWLFLTRRRSVIYCKLKNARQRRLLRKKRRFWVQDGRTEEWWQNMISGKAPEEVWKKNFRLPRKFHGIGRRALSIYFSKSFITKLSCIIHSEKTGSDFILP